VLTGVDGKTSQFCRVQAGELLGNIDSQELELRRYYDNANETFLIIEGIVSTMPISGAKHNATVLSVRSRNNTGLLYTYRVDGGFIGDEHQYEVPYARYVSWLHSLQECGISHFRTMSWQETARTIGIIHKHMNPEKPHDRMTLQRYIKPHIKLKEYNPHVMSLMGLEGVNLGEVKATALIGYFGTFIAVATACEDELCRVNGIGKTMAKQIIKAVGRDS
jgi:ERCC4-type nuclease